MPGDRSLFHLRNLFDTEFFKTAMEVTPETKENRFRADMGRVSELGKPMAVQGAALRALHVFLYEVDPKQH